MLGGKESAATHTSQLGAKLRTAMSFSCSHAGPSDLGGGAPTQGAAGPAGLLAGAIIYQGKKGYKMVRQYLMGDLLGEGAQGKVKEAVDSESLRRVAIKIINLRQLRKVRNAEENLRHELSIHRRLKQANVVELIEEFRVAEKEKLYVVLELVNGGSLQQLADSMPDHILPERLTARFTRMLFHGPGGGLQASPDVSLLRRRSPARLARGTGRSHEPGAQPEQLGSLPRPPAPA